MLLVLIFCVNEIHLTPHFSVKQDGDLDILEMHFPIDPQIISGSLKR